MPSPCDHRLARPDEQATLCPACGNQRPLPTRWHPDANPSPPGIDLTTLDRMPQCSVHDQFRVADGTRPEDWSPSHGDRPCPTPGHQDHRLDACPTLYEEPTP